MRDHSSGTNAQRRLLHSPPFAYNVTHFYMEGVYIRSRVMGRLIGGFSNYEPGKARGRGRQSDPSLLLWCISRAPATADPIHMAINGVLYINVIAVLPHISAWITPTTNYGDAMFYWVQEVLRMQILWLRVISLERGVIMFMNVHVQTNSYMREGPKCLSKKKNPCNPLVSLWWNGCVAW